MPFPFALPTTSSVLLSDCFSSVTHPSLPLQATTKRSVLKDTLKKHKRLPAQSRSSHLSIVQDALTNYIPYLLALNTASSFRDVGTERVDVDVVKPLEVEWRTPLTAALPGREAPRPKLTGIHNEIAFTFSTLAHVHVLLARSQLGFLHGSPSLSQDQRTTALATAMKHLLEAHSILKYLLSVPSVSASKESPIDVQPSTISALASLALAEATLTVVSKDDPYAAAVADDRDETNRDWMFKAPTIPKVRAHLFARICLAAAEHASQACGLLTGNTAGKVDEDLSKYANDLRRTARAKSIRFLAIDTELSGNTGEGLAWLRGAKKELGLAVELEDGKRKGFRGLKQSWQEKREDRRIEKGGEWGMDAGRLEEARVVEMLEAKWDRENSAVNVQTVPPFEPLLARLPTGREYHTPQAYEPPTLDAYILTQLRAPPDPEDLAFRGDEEDSGGEERFRRGDPPGAFPGAGLDYERSATSSSYY
ncbi:uncharacterized protein LTR77_001387 [Saxophila tyrrhenica]|uniref:pH-response regulator protein palC n=1 Tax=Saxophila tyrrhenica TaxID=1690608 RepID=A0AAV9PPR5_9PEZI|nr:hypothetical protein LTR77_001387 [Saxophila tyrrhenica]